MDARISIRPTAGSTLGRDPVAVRETGATELERSKTVTPPGDGSGRQHEQRRDGEREHPDHPPHDLLADPDSRDLIYRERDVRAAERALPDQALLRQRAYQPAAAPAATPADPATAPDAEPHADLTA